jgi:6-phosphogluconate dehydrogenase
MMAVVAEAWYLLTTGLALSYDEVGKVFEHWNESEELRNCFLLYIGVDVNKERDAKGRHPLGYVQDKVVQDVDESEGTGTWTCEEAVNLHSPAATILSAHLFRCASADLKKRMEYSRASDTRISPKRLDVHDKDDFIEKLRKTVYSCFLLCFIQGLSIIRKRDVQRGWNIDYPQLMQIWGNGTIIQASHIMAQLQEVSARTPVEQDTLLGDSDIHGVLNEDYECIREVVLRAVEADMIIPAVSQSLEYFKYMVSTELPTQFMEAELDYFGNHHFDMKGHGPGKPEKGKEHFEWKRALGKLDRKG